MAPLLLSTVTAFSTFPSSGNTTSWMTRPREENFKIKACGSKTPVGDAELETPGGSAPLLTCAQVKDVVGAVLGVHPVHHQPPEGVLGPGQERSAP